MADDISFPQIDPTHFDLIVVGTGLPESVIAAASSAAGKSVLHLDPNSFYGGNFSSFALDDFAPFLELAQRGGDDSYSTRLPSDDVDMDYIDVGLKSQSLYSDIEISVQGSSEDLGPSRKFSLDLSGPRALYCNDSAVNLLLKSGASHHVEFKSIDTSFIYGSNGKLSPVPDSRSAIFKDKSLSLVEKNQLMRFFKLVQEHIGFNETTQEEQKRISDEDLESPFMDFLTKQRLPPKIKSIILYAIAMADYDQESPEHRKNLVKTKDGIESLALYHSSVGRFANVPGALIYPIYGQGELPQAFCRAAAVKGALYVLRMPVSAVLLDKESKKYKGLSLSSGQKVFSNQLVTGPSFTLTLPSDLDFKKEMSEESIVRDVKGQVARAVCITRGSIISGLSNLLVVCPPRSLYPKQVTSVRVLQLSSNVAACPSSLYVLYLSVLCDDAAQGKESLHAAVNALLICSTSERRENSAVLQHETIEEGTPTLLWSAMYIQQLTKVSSDDISFCPMPDGKLDYRDIMESTEKLFRKIYPDEEFLPETSSPENMADEMESE